MATIILKPIMPSGLIFLALSNSLLIARRFASNGSLSNSGSKNPICAADIVPAPPAFATSQSRKTYTDTHTALKDRLFQLFIFYFYHILFPAIINIYEISDSGVRTALYCPYCHILIKTDQSGCEVPLLHLPSDPLKNVPAP